MISSDAPAITNEETASEFRTSIAKCNAVFPLALSCIAVLAPKVKRSLVGSRLKIKETTTFTRHV